MSIFYFSVGLERWHIKYEYVQHPHQVAHNCLELQLQETQHLWPPWQPAYT